MKNKIVWLIGIAVSLIFVFHLTNLAFFHSGQATFGPSSTTVGHQMMMHHFQKGGFDYLSAPRHGMGVQHHIVRGELGQHRILFPLLLDLGLIIAGLTLLKFAGKKSITKGVGIALLFVGLWTLLPNSLAILLLLLGGFYWYKTRNDDEVPVNVVNDFASVPNQNFDFLDEWERTIKKEEK